jgi:hypothetical protein
MDQSRSMTLVHHTETSDGKLYSAITVITSPQGHVIRQSYSNSIKGLGAEEHSLSDTLGLIQLVLEMAENERMEAQCVKTLLKSITARL